MAPAKDRPALAFEGHPVAFEPGDTVAAALLRSGVLTFSRGPKYHRPRGPFCLAGSCAQCHMRVGGEPNVATCLAPATDGLQIERQNSLGSADTDLLRVVDWLYPGGIDHHHLMTSNRLLNVAAQSVARRLAGIGEVPSSPLPVRPARIEKAPLVVIGGGPAGLAAAVSASRNGITPLVFEARGEPGGHVPDGLSDDASLSAATIGVLAEEISRKGELAVSTRVAGLYSDGLRRIVVARDSRGLRQIEVERVIVATGGVERPIPFESNDLPGVFGGRGLLRLVRRSGVKPGSRVVVIGSTADAIRVAQGLREAGLVVAAILDPANMLEPVDGVEIRRSVLPIRALGRARVEELLLREADGTTSRIACDLIASTAALQPAFEVAAEAGARTEYRPEAGGFAVVVDDFGATSVPWLFAGGGVAGEPVPPLVSGDLAGIAAAASLDPEEPALQRLLATKAQIRAGFVNRDARR